MLRSATAAGFGLALVALLMAAPVSANTITYHAYLAGTNEVPANASPATGFATFVFDDVANTLLVDETFSGLIGGNAAAAQRLAAKNREAARRSFVKELRSWWGRVESLRMQALAAEEEYREPHAGCERQ